MIILEAVCGAVELYCTRENTGTLFSRKKMSHKLFKLSLVHFNHSPSMALLTSWMDSCILCPPPPTRPPAPRRRCCSPSRSRQNPFAFLTPPLAQGAESRSVRLFCCSAVCAFDILHAMQPVQQSVTQRLPHATINLLWVQPRQLRQRDPRLHQQIRVFYSLLASTAVRLSPKPFSLLS